MLPSEWLPVGTLPHADSPTLTHAVSGWDDGSCYAPKWIRNLDNTLHWDDDGLAWLAYQASDRELQYSGATYLGDTDVPGIYSYSTTGGFTKVSTSSAILLWANGTHSNAGGLWDCRVVQPYSYFWTGTEYVMFYSGDRGPRGVVEDYSFGIATAPHPSGPWTKQNPGDTNGYQITHQGTSAFDTIMYGGHVVHDAAGATGEKWRTYYTAYGNSSNNWTVGLMLQEGYEDTPTRYGQVYDWTAQNFYTVGVAWAGKYDDGWYMALECWDHEPVSGYSYGRKHVYLFHSTDGKTSWTNLGEIFTSGSSGAWDDEIVYNFEIVEDAENGVMRVAYTGSGLAPLTDERNLAIGVAVLELDGSPGLTLDESSIWTQDGYNLTVTGASANTRHSTTATVGSRNGGTVRFTGADAAAFYVSSDGFTWASSLTVPAGSTDIHVSVLATPEPNMASLSATMLIPV